MRENWGRALLIAVVSCWFLVGCGSQFGAEVQGVVTLDGQPLPIGTVTFHPESNGTTSYGRIQSDGTFRMKTGQQKGLPPGRYTVTVSAREPNTQRSEGGGPPRPGKSLVAAKYSNRNTSGLEYTVDQGRNEFEIKLVSE